MTDDGSVIGRVQGAQMHVAELMQVAKHLLETLNNDALYVSASTSATATATSGKDSAIKAVAMARKQFDQALTELEADLVQLNTIKDQADAAPSSASETDQKIKQLQARHSALVQSVTIKTKATGELVDKLRTVQLHVLNMTAHIVQEKSVETPLQI